MLPGGFSPSMTVPDTTSYLSGPKGTGSKLSLRDLTERTLLRRVVPTAVLVDGNGDILYFHGRTGMYLEPAPGETGANNILKMAREGLRAELTTALRAMAAGLEIVRRTGLRVKTNGEYTSVDLCIHAVTADSSAPPLYLVVLEPAREFDSWPGSPMDAQETDRPSPAVSPGGDEETDARLVALRHELRIKEEYLQTALEELETSNEELRSSNEEMQSVNEELQSSNEELETSKEELQSLNEELATVNAELQAKVADLSRANNDLNNLMAGTGIGTVFVDHELRILRFTPAATRIINLIQADIGRPVGHIVSNLMGYDRLTADVRSVLNDLVPKEMEVRSQTGAWYTMRIQPYRTLNNVIEGAVITFVDITKLKRANESSQ